MEMEQQRTTRNDLEKKKKIAIKIGGGGGGGGGIGAIILMSGVLATAALASAFVVVTKKKRSSGKDRRRQNTPQEVNHEQSAIDCDPDTSSSDHVDEYPSCEAIKEVEMESLESLILDDKPGIEINGGTPGDVFDVETYEQIPSSINPKEDSGIIKDESQSLDETLRFDHKNMMHEEKIQLIDEDITGDGENVTICSDGNNFQQEENVVREISSDGEIQGIHCTQSVELTEMKLIEGAHTEICCDQEESEVGVDIDHIEEEKSLNREEKMEEKELEGCFDGEIIEETKEDVGKTVVELRNGNQEAILETIYSESHVTDGQKAICPVVETPVIEQENVNGEEKEGVVSIENADVILEDEAIEEGEKEEMGENIEEQFVPEKCGLQIIVEDGKIPSENQEEFGVSVLKEEVILPEVAKDDGENEQIAENLEMNEKETSVKDDEDNVERNMSKEVAEEMVFPKDIGVKEDDGSDEEISEIREANETENILLEADEIDVEKTILEEVEGSSETGATEKDDGVMKMSEDNIKDYYNDEAVEIDLSDEVEESSVGTGDSSVESNEEAVWPAKSLSLDQEVQGKFQEDKAINREFSSFEAHQVKEEEFNPEKGCENVPTMADSSKSKMSFTEKYMGELATLKMLAANPTWRIIILGMLSVLSSLSCSWLFGLPFVKLCLILFLSMVLTEIHGY